MNPIFHERGSLAPVESRRLSHHFAECLVIGGGVAGLRAAIEASQTANVLLLAKAEPTESNTYHAQGGVAAALGPGDSVESHVADTLACGGGLCDERVVRVVAGEGPERVGELIKWGARFDLVGGKLDFTLEGGHSVARVLHAHGDATGREIAHTLLRAARQCQRVEILPGTFVVDLVTDPEGACRGVLAWRPDRGLFAVWAGSVILATGGAGQLYRESTNSSVATADGQAMAWRAGASLSDMEMIQFHPTTLYVAGASRELITEAVRGEGAHLLDRTGERFMLQRHPLAELAPRDVVSRAIWQRMAETRSPYVLLDVRHIGREKFAARFPGIFELLQRFDIDVQTTPIPVRPAAHYIMGGVRTDLEGRTGIRGLFAAGEVAATGLHGANRLASNSLLEGLVFGARVGRAAAQSAAGRKIEPMAQLANAVTPGKRTELDLADVRNSLRSLMVRNLGVERDGERLAESAEIIDFWARYVMDKTFGESAGWELQNMLTVSALIIQAALTRTESRGVHFRRDHPEPDDAKWRSHLDWTRGQAVRRRPVGGAIR